MGASKGGGKAGSDLGRVEVRSRAELRAWLRKHHRQAASIWLVTWKKRPGAPHVPYSDVVEEALCFGWIDSLPRKLDDDRSMLLLSPRKPRSNWSRLNKQRAESLIQRGLMTEAGQAVIDEAKRTGRWNALDKVEDLEIPPDLAAALRKNPRAREKFEAFSRSSKRGILEWILNAKKPETRTSRIDETIAMAAIGLRASFPEARAARKAQAGE